MSIQVRAKRSDARAAAGHNPTQWKRFLTLTWEETEKLYHSQPSWSSWSKVPANVQTQLLETLNESLAQEEIPKITVEVLNWRMAQAIRTAHKKTNNDDTSQSEASGATVGEANQQSGKDAASGRYDPVRDLVRDFQ
ncbi:hypothetical protein K469DRAFT_658203 [Zopfia rhizophila CBS 207.26]|uniref:Uncharacterized protein n=1 Tax=Zopfia rhizophila CBS 207.26 TaxID=1314779 RepID=A0A6A6EGC1_9PEZI|nr:hypothetical protein K469DRAFT_658203 [Zopfia rhizophila CBS 207.26]